MSLITIVEKRSSYAISTECTEALSEIRTMMLLLMSMVIAMKNFPRSGVMQVISRSLNFYGFSKYYTKLIDEYDRESVPNCALIITSQFLDPPNKSNHFIYVLNDIKQLFYLI